MTTTDLGEWQPVFTAAGYAGEVPVTLQGPRLVYRDGYGKAFPDHHRGYFAVTGFRNVNSGHVAHPGKNRSTGTRCGRIFQLSPSVVCSAQCHPLSRDPDSVKFDFRAQLDQRQFTDASQVQAHLDTENADLPGILALVGLTYPVTGVVDLHLQVGGNSHCAARGQGTIRLRDGSIYGEPVEHFTSELSFNGEEAELKDIQLTHYESKVNGDAAFNPSSQAFHFALTGTNFDLARISRLQDARIAVTGRANFTAQGSGTVQQPTLNAEIHLQDLAFDNERAGDFTINAVSQGAELKISGQSQFEQADLKIDGDVHLREDWPSDVYFHFHQFDLDAVFRTYMRGVVNGHSRADGEVHMVGPLRRPRELQFIGQSQQSGRRRGRRKDQEPGTDTLLDCQSSTAD